METMEAGNKLVNEREAARILCVSPGTLSVWRSTRRWPLPFVRVGSAIRYSVAALEKFVAERTIVPEPKTTRPRARRPKPSVKRSRSREAGHAAD